MTATTFNALVAARSLKAAGIEAEHAEAIAEGMREAAGADRDDVATKDDFAHFATKADLAELETRLRAATRADLYRGIRRLALRNAMDARLPSCAHRRRRRKAVRHRLTTENPPCLTRHCPRRPPAHGPPSAPSPGRARRARCLRSRNRLWRNRNPIPFSRRRRGERVAPGCDRTMPSTRDHHHEAPAGPGLPLQQHTMTATLKRTACQAAAVCLFTTRCAFRQVKWKHEDSFIYRYESYSTKRTAVP